MASGKQRDPEIVPLICEAIARRKKIGVEDAIALTKFCRRGIALTIGEAEAVFTLARAKFPCCPEWSDFFAETMSAWFIETYARNDVTVEAAGRLIDWLGGAEARLDASCFRFLTNVLELAPVCPEILLAFARGCLLRAMGVDRMAPEPGAQVA